MKKSVKIVKNIVLVFLSLYENCASIAKNIFSVHKIISKEWQDGSFYGIGERKSNFRIYFENLLWLLKNKEINHLYYAYRFDRKKQPIDQNRYLPISLFRRIRYRINKGDSYNYECILRDKLMFHNFIKGVGLNTPRIIAIGNCEKLFLLEQNKKLHIRQFINDCKNSTFFYKDQMGECGKGVYKIDINGRNIYLNDSISSADEVIKALLKIKNYIVQEKIEQHEMLAQFHPSSINTIRLVTIKNRAGVHVFEAIARFGTGGRSVDNTSIGGIFVHIDCDKECLKEFGYKSLLKNKACYQRVSKNDDSAMVFKDFNIPFFSQALNGAKILHSFLDIQSIGWDIAITKHGPVYIEGNDNWEISSLQFGGGLKQKFYELING